MEYLGIQFGRWDDCRRRVSWLKILLYCPLYACADTFFINRIGGVIIAVLVIAGVDGSKYGSAVGCIMNECTLFVLNLLHILALTFLFLLRLWLNVPFFLLRFLGYIL